MRILPWNISAVTHNLTPLRIHSRAKSKNQFMPISSDWKIVGIAPVFWCGITPVLHTSSTSVHPCRTCPVQCPVHFDFLGSRDQDFIQTSFKIGHRTQVCHHFLLILCITVKNQAQIIFRIKTNIALTSWDVPPSGNYNPRIVTVFTLVLSCQVSRGGRGVTLL